MRPDDPQQLLRDPNDGAFASLLGKPPTPQTELTLHSGAPATEETVRWVAAQTIGSLNVPVGAPTLLLRPEVPSNQPHHTSDEVVRQIWRHAATERSKTAFNGRRFDGKMARSWLAARQRDGSPSLLVGDSTTLTQLLDYLERLRLLLRLPAGTRIVEILDGHLPEPLSASPSANRLGTVLGLAPDSRQRLLSWSTLTSPCWTAQEQADDTAFTTPPWVRTRAVAKNQSPLAEGMLGRLALCDLATTELPAWQLTELSAAVAGSSVSLAPGR